ncbi:MAG: PPC domain-containing protein [Chloroflexota bacterium]
MSRIVKRRLIFGVLFILIGCLPANEDEPNEPTIIEVEETVEIVQEVTATPNVTSAPPVLPTPLPTEKPDAWLRVGSEASGVQLSIPPEWVNLSGALDTVSATNALGLVVLLTSDTERTGSALLAGKGSGEGAYAAGLITNLALPSGDPTVGLSTLTEQLVGQGVTVPQVSSIASQVNSEGRTIGGAFVDVEGTAVIFPDSANQQMRTRLLYFPISGADANEPKQALFIMSADASQWSTYEPIFNRMMNQVVVYDLMEDDLVINDGRANVEGSLGQTDVVNGRLEANVSDIWTFSAESNQYATINISPDDRDIDLILKLIDPNGKTVVQIDNAFAGDTEVVLDLLLTESGMYVIEVSEFFQDLGRYTLSLVLTDEPLFSGGGEITFGQTIQSDLPTASQKFWLFEGVAGEEISVVLIPEGEFDGILELYAPNGEKLVGLDEGFNGDAEVISGYALPLSGEYRIVVSSFAGNGGVYSLSLDRGGEDTTNFYDAGDLAFGETQQEELRPNEAHAWFFNGRIGDDVTIVVRPLESDLDIDLWLLNPNIERINSQDLFLAGEPERLEQRLPEDGQYLILVSDFYGVSGRYEISLSAQPIATPQPVGVLQLGTAVTGALQSNQTNIWYFDGSAGDIVTFELTGSSANADLLFDIIDPAGNRVKIVDEQITGSGELFERYTLSEDGRWGVVIREFYNEASSYSLLVKRAQ